MDTFATHRSPATDNELDRPITIRGTFSDDDLLDRSASSEATRTPVRRLADYAVVVVSNRLALVDPGGGLQDLPQLVFR